MEEYVAYEETLGEFKLKIVGDNDAENPYSAWDQLTDLVTWHRRTDFTMGEKYDSPEEVIEAYERGEIVYFAPLFAYEHGGITVRLGSMNPRWPDQQWDCGLLGMVYVTKKKAKDNWPKLANRTLWLACERTAKGEVETLDDYLTGEVYGFVIEDGEENHLDSCWGFYGDYEKSGVLEDGRESLKYHYKQSLKPYKDSNQLLLFEEV